MIPIDDDDYCDLRAIALSLEALRQVDRYGVTRNREQYEGFTAFPPARHGMSADEAADYIELHSENYRGRVTLQARMYFDAAYREAARKLHPDRGGSHEQFVRLQRAKEAVEAHYA